MLSKDLPALLSLGWVANCLYFRPQMHFAFQYEYVTLVVFSLAHLP